MVHPFSHWTTIIPYYTLVSGADYFSTLSDMGAYLDAEKDLVGWRLFYFIGEFEGALDFLFSILVVVFFHSKRTAIPMCISATSSSVF